MLMLLPNVLLLILVNNISYIGIFLYKIIGLKNIYVKIFLFFIKKFRLF